MNVDQHRARLTTAGNVVQSPENPTKSIVMPSQVIPLTGTFVELDGRVKVGDILSGRTRLEIDVELSYQATSSWWPWTYYYRATYLFLAPERMFLPTASEAN